MFRHGAGEFIPTFRTVGRAPATVGNQVRVAQRAPPQPRLVDPVPNQPQASGPSNQQKKPQNRGKQNVKREETGGQKSLPSNASAERQKSKQQDGKSRKITILSANGGQTWSLDFTFLTQQSKVLENMFKHPGNELRGLLRHGKPNTFKLDGIEAGHFDMFLSALQASAGSDPSVRSLDDLKTILGLASDWGFSKLRKQCMTAIKKLRPSPVEKLLLARRSQIPEWIREAYLTLAIRTPG
ncbi:hypothetical protein FRC01_004080, partial [Tulasnella sp. 417]